MRRFILVTATAAMATASPAAAQMGMGGMGGLGAPQTAQSTETTALGKLPEHAQSWMAQESVHQAQEPESLSDLDDNIEEAVGDDLEAAGQRGKYAKSDLAAAMRFEIVREARRLMETDLKLRKKAAGETPSDEDMLSIANSTSRLTRLRALEEQARRRLTAKASSIVSD